MQKTTLTFFFAVATLAACTSDPGDRDTTGHNEGGSSAGGAGGKASSGGQGATNATIGRIDDVAKHACDAWAGKLAASVASKTVNAVEKSDYAELAQAKLTVDGGTLYSINLPEGKESWMAVDENFWESTLAFFAPKGVTYEVRNSNMKPESNGPLKNGACPDTHLTDYRVFFDHWTPATIRFSADGPRQVKFMIVRDEANSLPAAPM